jgi:2-polyprenyl-6-methoxyphenol hydroxylase-like FAD-dependent oxidoreductase
MYDLIVVGGGPVGIATAILAVRSGLSTVVLEPRTGSIDKACGEGLLPAAVNGLRKMGVAADGRPFVGIRYLRGTRVAEAPFRTGPGMAIRRTVLHLSLSSAAAELAIEILPIKVTEVTQDATGVNVAGIRARYLIGADGLHSAVRRAVRLERPAGSGPARYGVRQHIHHEPWTRMVDVHWTDHAEVYITPIADDIVGVAVLARGGGDQRLDYHGAIRSVPALAERIADSSPVSSLRGAGPLRQRTVARTAGRVLLVGDAAGYVDALTGEGLSMGFAEAAAAVRCLRRDRPADYEALWSQITRRYRLLTGGLLWAQGIRPLRRTIVPAASRLPGIFTAVVNSLGAREVEI